LTKSEPLQDICSVQKWYLFEYTERLSTTGITQTPYKVL